MRGGARRTSIFAQIAEVLNKVNTPGLLVCLGENKNMHRPKPIEEAVEKLYIAFSGYPLPEDTEPCGCCHSTDANQLLHAAPLRELQWEHLAEYSTEALMVWGNLDCYKHFLPRVFELVLTAGKWPETPTPEMVFKVLQYGAWHRWPSVE